MLLIKSLLLTLVFLALPIGAEEGGFVWPLRLDPALSSTFGESRAAHFHAGIDLKTWGKTGYEVQALADGYIWRVRTSPWGYGRTIYQKLDDGRTVVYAHLQRFESPLAERVLQAQKDRTRYSVDLYFKEGEIPVRGGDLIAWSGESGAGFPHLHLELRDGENVPVNPLTNGFVIADTVAPTLENVAITPYGRTARVIGGHDPQVLHLDYRPERNEFVAADAVQVLGWVGISALVYDRADAAPNEMAPYSIALEIGDRPIFAARYDQVDYGDRHQVFLDRTRLSHVGGTANFFNLCRLPGNRLEFYQDSGDGFLNAGKGELSRGLHQAVITAADVNGNESRARFRLLVDASPEITGTRIVSAEEGVFIEASLADADDAVLEVELAGSVDGETWREVDRRQSQLGPLRWRIQRRTPYWRIRALDPLGAEAEVVARLPELEESAPDFIVERHPHRDFVEVAMRYTRVPSVSPQVRAGSDRLVARQVNPREYRVTVPLKPGAEVQLPVVLYAPGAEVQQISLDQQLIRPGVAQDLHYHDGQLSLRLAETSAYAPFFPQVTAYSPQVPAGLIAAGEAYALGPEFSFDQKVELRLRYAGSELPLDKLGIYREGTAGKWGMVGNELDTGVGEVSARLRRLGRYALLADLNAPEIDKLMPADGAVVDRRPEISAGVLDTGAGIGREEDIELVLDDRLLIAEYDPDADRVSGLLLSDLAPGRHLLVLRVRDRSGNLAEARSEFEVR